MSVRDVLALGAVVLGSLGAAAPGAGAAPAWTLASVSSPEGLAGPFSVGDVGDLKVIAPNRALLTTEGTAVMPRGIYAYDGTRWRLLASVCGGSARNARLAIASPTEFWAIADTNPTQPGLQVGGSVCRFHDGGVTSYAVPGNAQDQWFPLRAATCLTPTNCWFAGDPGTSNDQVRSGGFHLQTNGPDVATAYAPQGTRVTEIEGFAGFAYEALETTDTSPMLVRVGADGFTDTGLEAPEPGKRTEVFALDSSGPRLWLGGGSARTVPAAERTALPFVRVFDGTTFTTVSLGPSWRAGDRVVDIAAIPGTDRAWAVVQNQSEEGSADVAARVALLDVTSGVVRLDEIPQPDGVVRGAGVRIDCATIDDCWLATAGGWLYHLTDGTRPAQDSGFFDTTITVRPRDGRSPQVRPDTPPVDDSLLFAAAPEPKATAPKPPAARRLPALIGRVKAKVRGRRALVIRFSVRRLARVRIVGTRGGKVVARTPRRTLKKGTHVLVLPLNPKRYPTGIKFQTTDLEQPATPKPEAGIVTTSAVLRLLPPRS